MKIIELKETVTASNDRDAAVLREELRAKGTLLINLMSSLCGGTAYVGWILALVIFFGGHVFSMVINILGAFVHPLRLQYVEFFGKFYSSGGVAFQPFRYKTDYVNVAARKDASPAAPAGE